MAFRFFSESREAVNEYKAARAAQDKLCASQRKRGIEHQTPAGEKASARTDKAASKVSWFRQ